MHSWFLGLDLDVDDLRIRCAFTAEDAELHQVVFFTFGFDVDAAVSVVVLHEAFDVVLHGIAMHITPKTDVEHTTVNANGVSFHGGKITVFS